MSRFLCSIIFLLFVQSLKSQDLANRIPADAVGVVQLNTPRFFEHVGVDEFSQSALGALVLHSLNDTTYTGKNNLADYGIALDRSAYLYSVHTDSVQYTTFLWPVADVGQLERHVFAGKEVVSVGGYRQYLDKPDNAYGTTTVYVWNDELLTVTSLNQVAGYFEDEEVAKRYGIGNKGYYDFYEEYEGSNLEEETYDDTGYWGDSTSLTDIVADDVPYLLTDSTDVREDASVAADTAALDDDDGWDTEVFAWEDMDSAYAETEGDGYSDWYNLYDEAYQRDLSIKDSVRAVWASTYAQQLLAGPAADNILNNASYLAIRNDKAIASAWIPDFTAFYSFFWPEIFNIGLGVNEGLKYYGAMHMDIFADRNLRVVSRMEVADNLAKPLKRMYDRKINRKFFRYIDSEDMLGLYGFSANTKAVLEELPVFLKETYGGIMGPYREDIGFAADMVSLLLDEEAISQLVRGDGVFVLNGLEEQEVPFTHYDWDEDYNWIEVDSVKNELVPDFLFMLSSDDRQTYDRLVSYLVAKGLVGIDGRLAEVKAKDMPFSVYMAHHNGILFVGTSAEKMEAIAGNRYRGKTLRSHRRMLRGHVATGLFNVENAVNEFDNEQLNTLDRYIGVRKIFGSMGNMQYTARMQGNHMIHEFESHTPREYRNAIHQLLSLFDYMRDTL